MSSEITASETLAALRHSLRTPLNHIIGYAEVLLEDGLADGEATHLRSILSGAQKICDLIQTMPSNPTDSEAEVDRLRRGIERFVHIIDQHATKLSDVQAQDRGRIQSAISELASFARTGKVAPLSQERTAAVLRQRPVDLRGSERLLIVDDDEANRDVLSRHLVRQGYEVDQAASGREALRMLWGQRYDAVLLDLVMPHMDGFELLSRIKADAGTADIPIIVISASDELSAVADSIQRGADDYLFRPFDPVVLHTRLSAALERSRLRAQERRRNAELETITADLKRSNEDLQRFAYAASHDLQAPVRTITSYLQLLERRLGSRLREDEREMIGFAQSAAKRMHVLIRDLLAYSHASTEAVEFKAVDMEELLCALVDDMAIPIKESGATVTWQKPAPTLSADPTALRQILQNLVSNAIKYCRDEPPAVHISVNVEQDHWRICVCDNGQGIAPEYSSRIFEMFQRLHGEDRPGSGIGLSICQRLVDRLGGKIWVDSEPGRGSTFCFTIPKR